MMTRMPLTVGECDEQIIRVKQAMDECLCSEHVLICSYAADLVLLETRRTELAVIPRSRPPSDP